LCLDYYKHCVLIYTVILRQKAQVWIRFNDVNVTQNTSCISLLGCHSASLLQSKLKALFGEPLLFVRQYIIVNVFNLPPISLF